MSVAVRQGLVPEVRLLTRAESEEVDRVYWHTKTPWERLAAAKQLRQIAYGYNAAAARIQAVAEYVPLRKG